MEGVGTGDLLSHKSTWLHSRLSKKQHIGEAAIKRRGGKRFSAWFFCKCHFAARVGQVIGSGLGSRSCVRA